MTTNISQKTITVKANQALEQSVTGKYFFCVSASGPIQMSIGGAEQVTVIAGIAFPTDQIFTRIVFQNTSAADITLTFITGSQGVSYFPPQTNVIQSNAATYLKGSGDIALAAAGTQNFTGLDGTKVRKIFTITNTEAAGSGNVCLILDGNGNKFMQVFPQRSIALETSGTLTIKNPNGGAITVEVGEIFYS